MADTAGQSAADSDAAARREADLKSAADSLAAQRAAQDEATAQKRLAEDEALADTRTEQDRVLASSRTRLSAAANAVQAATASVSDDAGADDPHTADLRAAVAELQAALSDHLNLVPGAPGQDPDGTVAP